MTNPPAPLWGQVHQAGEPRCSRLVGPILGPPSGAALWGPQPHCRPPLSTPAAGLAPRGHLPPAARGTAPGGHQAGSPPAPRPCPAGSPRSPAPASRSRCAGRSWLRPPAPPGPARRRAACGERRGLAPACSGLAAAAGAQRGSGAASPRLWCSGRARRARPGRATASWWHPGGVSRILTPPSE